MKIPTPRRLPKPSPIHEGLFPTGGDPETCSIGHEVTHASQSVDLATLAKCCGGCAVRQVCDGEMGSFGGPHVDVPMFRKPKH